MKRNDIFMWAYISFIFVCIILRMNWAFPLWGAVVIAITISSVFFATEDLLSSVARFLQETCDVADKFIETAKKGIAKDREFLDKIGKNAELLKNEEYNISDVNISFDSVRNWVSELESYV